MTGLEMWFYTFLKAFAQVVHPNSLQVQLFFDLMDNLKSELLMMRPFAAALLLYADVRVPAPAAGALPPQPGGGGLQRRGLGAVLLLLLPVCRELLRLLHLRQPGDFDHPHVLAVLLYVHPVSGGRGGHVAGDQRRGR